MFAPQNRRTILFLFALLMLISGIGLMVRAVFNLSINGNLQRTFILQSLDQPTIVPVTSVSLATATVASETISATLLTVIPTPSPSPTAVSSPIPTIVPTPTAIPISIAMAAGIPQTLQGALGEMNVENDNLLTHTELLSSTPLLDWNPIDGTAFFTQTFAAATRFDMIDPNIDWDGLRQMWQGEALTFTSVAILSDTLPALEQVLGAPSSQIEAHDTMTNLLATAWDDRSTLVLIPFDQLVPRLLTLAIDGQNPLENGSHFDPSRYPFTAILYLHPAAISPLSEIAAQTDKVLAQLPRTNRDPTKLTVVAMTGVTAMSRVMGKQMDELGALWPSAVVSEELASADLTIFSNEVAFAPDCEINPSPNALLFCSKPEYWETLESSGVDLISLTGNHVNDWGRESLSWTLDFYDQKGITVYGGGANAEEAVKPRIVEHNSNRLAFLGANTVGPVNAWATESLPGAARFDFAQANSLIEQARTDEGANVVFYDVQYLESYNPWPLYDQRETFNLLLREGADVVSGMQSHVPQSMEFTDGKLILYGLGNLYFDQMWSETTRQSLIAKHTIYNGRHIGTQILVTVLYDYGQPHWATAEERAEILQRLFTASYW